MTDIIVYIFLGLCTIGLAISLFHIIGKFIWILHRNWNYRDGRGWHECRSCGVARETVYFIDTYWGRIYHCGDRGCWEKWEHKHN